MSTGLPVHELVRLAKEATDEVSPAVAAKYLEEAVNTEPDNAYLVHQLGEAYLDLGQGIQAHEMFLRSAQLRPTDIPENYMYIAQGTFGRDALDAYLRAVQILETQRGREADASNEESKEQQHLGALLCRIFIAIGELYMTDLCDEEDAESQCEAYLMRSIATNPNDPEAHASLGELRLVQQRGEEASKHFEDACQRLTQPDAFSFLAVDSFLKIAKLGLETEQFEKSLKILTSLVKLHEDIGEAWALGALAHYKMNNLNETCIWLENAQSIAHESGEEEGMQEVLGPVLQQIDMNHLPDLDRLTLDVGDDDDQDMDGKDDVESFLEDVDTGAEGDDERDAEGNLLSEMLAAQALMQIEESEDHDMDEDPANMLAQS